VSSDDPANHVREVGRSSGGTRVHHHLRAIVLRQRNVRERLRCFVDREVFDVRGNADDGERLGIDSDGSADDLLIGAKHPPPETVADDRDRVSFWRNVVVLVEHPSELCVDAERLEVPSAHDLGPDAFRPPVVRVITTPSRLASSTPGKGRRTTPLNTLNTAAFAPGDRSRPGALRRTAPGSPG
jgi:hypothetical protein